MSEFLVDTIFVWHKELSLFLRELGYKGEIIVSGPIMPGKEITNTNEVKRYKEELNFKFTEDKFIISLFDVPPVNSKSVNILMAVIPCYDNEENLFKFLNDTFALLELSDKIVIAYKPKRNLMISKFIASDRVSNLLAKYSSHERVIILKDNINPWIPVAICDMAIGMLFTSPVLIGLNWGKHYFFYDSSNRVKFHRYASIKESILITKQDLETKVIQAIQEKDFNHSTLQAEGFYVKPLDTGYSETLMKYLYT